MSAAAQKQAQSNRGTLFLEDGEILSAEAFPGEQFVQRIRAPRCAATANAGSFVHIRCDESLPMRRPLSIMRAHDDWIEVLYKIVGDGLRLLSQKQCGDLVSVLGPIGIPFTADRARPNSLLIGGGVGIPPMVFLADVLRDNHEFRPFAILGSEIPFPFELAKSKLPVAGVEEHVSSTMPLLEAWGIPTRLCSLAGYEGCFNGYVTELLEQYLAGKDATELAQIKLFSCGPTLMLKAVADLAAQYDIPCEVSLEEFMACAVGGCGGCTVLVETPQGPAMKRVCVDGPVFNSSSIAW